MWRCDFGRKLAIFSELLKKCAPPQIVEKQKKPRKFHYHYLKNEE